MLYTNELVVAATLVQTLVAVANVIIVGKGLIVSVNAFAVLGQAPAFVTVMVALYVPAATLAPIGKLIGDTGKAVEATFTKPEIGRAHV